MKSLWQKLVKPASILALLAACSDDPVNTTAKPSDQVFASVNGASDFALGVDQDHYWASLAKNEVPGFAGLVVEDGETILLTTKPENSAAAISQLRQLRPNDQSLRGMVRSRGVRYDFAELRSWADELLQTDNALRITLLDVDQSRNRILIGVSDGADVGIIRAWLVSKRIPEDGYVVKTSPPFKVEGDIRTRIGGQIPFGVQIQRQTAIGDYKNCTLGPAVRRNHTRGYNITAGHCTATFTQYEGTSWYQPDHFWPTEFYEYTDPAPFTGYPCPFGRNCRYADAALIQNNFSLNHDTTMAYPDVENGFTFSTRIHIDGAWGEIWMLAPPNPGMKVEKVGIATGRTSGIVNYDCTGILGENNIWIPCAYLANYSSDPGDSGAPVYFDLTPNYTQYSVTIYGVHMGRSADNYAVFSSWDELRKDFARVGATVSAYIP